MRVHAVIIPAEGGSSPFLRGLINFRRMKSISDDVKVGFHSGHNGGLDPKSQRDGSFSFL